MFHTCTVSNIMFPVNRVHRGPCNQSRPSDSWIRCGTYLLHSRTQASFSSLHSSGPPYIDSAQRLTCVYICHSLTIPISSCLLFVHSPTMSSGMTPSTTLDLFGRNNIARSRHVTRETLAEGASSLQLLFGALNYGFSLRLSLKCCLVASKVF